MAQRPAAEPAEGPAEATGPRRRRCSSWQEPNSELRRFDSEFVREFSPVREFVRSESASSCDAVPSCSAAPAAAPATLPREASKRSEASDDWDQALAITTRASERLLWSFRERPVAVAQHVLLIVALVPYCAPEKGFLPPGEKWKSFPLLALAHGLLKVLRLTLRCTAFTVCMLRCVRRQNTSQHRFRVKAWVMVVEIFATVWPTEGIANVAFISFFLSRTFTIPWVLMDVVVGERSYDSGCGIVAIAQSLLIRSYWIVGFVLGLRYFRELKDRDSDSGVVAGKFHLHPRMWKMIQSPSFHSYALVSMAGWLLASVLECSALYRWEVGVPDTGLELDAFRNTKEFFETYKGTTWKSPSEEWHLRRVVGGNWRESFYLVMMFPRSAFAAAAALLALASMQTSRFSAGPWPWLITTSRETLLGLASYVLCLSAHQLQYLVLCLLVSWECYSLQQRCEAFQRSFGSLSSGERVVQHQDLGKKMDGVGRRLHPIIVFLVLERATQLSLDAAQWRCESAPFTLLHYAFRHIVRTLGVAAAIWRIGRLNASIYDDLTGKVQFQLVCCHQEPEVGGEELQRRRRELRDWVAYLQHNSNGSRRYCLRVCGFQCCLRPHTAAAWAVTLALLPAGQRLLGLLPGL